MEFTDIMIDLETMGKNSSSAIVSIGAVEFNIETGETGREFYQVVNLQSCLDLGLKVQADTIYFWLQQNQAARDGICRNNKLSLYDTLLSFNYWMQNCISGINVWGNSVRFDVGLLTDAYLACDLEIPWDFRTERDVRTLVAFAPEIKSNMPFKGTIHNPIDDCKHQIKYCTATWKKINNIK